MGSFPGRDPACGTVCPSTRAPTEAIDVNIRPATAGDADFLKTMLFEAARWNPDWPREPIDEVLDDPMLRRYHEGWGRQGDGGVVAELDGSPAGAVWYRQFTEDEPGFGFIDEKTPELSVAVQPLHRRRASVARCFAPPWCRPAKRASSRSRCRSRCTTARACCISERASRRSPKTATTGRCSSTSE